MNIKVRATIEGVSYAPEELLHFSDTIRKDPEKPEWIRSVYSFIADWLSDSPDIIQYSSGTTGKSKKIILSKQAMEASAIATCRFLDLRAGQAALLCLPVDYIAGKMMVVRALTCGLDLLMEAPSGIPDLRPGKAAFTALVPLQVANLLQSGKEASLPEKVIIGGAEIPRELERRIRELPGEIYATYGMAETCSHVALQRLNGPEHREDFQALPGITLEQDERECLVIMAPYLSHPVHTNDLVAFTSPGTFIWRGRYDNLINSGGIKLVPEEIESRIREITGCECAVIGIPDLHLGQQAVVFLESREPSLSNDFEQGIRTAFPHPVKPARVVLVPGLPRNASMKIDRPGLLEKLPR
jgi:O-succinylbenzoic acid--CoA ligase